MFISSLSLIYVANDRRTDTSRGEDGDEGDASLAPCCLVDQKGVLVPLHSFCFKYK